MVSALDLTPTGGSIIFCWNFLKPLDVNAGLKCKFDLIVKNSIPFPTRHSHCTFSNKFILQALLYIAVQYNFWKLLLIYYWSKCIAFRNCSSPLRTNAKVIIVTAPGNTQRESITCQGEIRNQIRSNWLPETLLIVSANRHSSATSNPSRRNFTVHSSIANETLYLFKVWFYEEQ